jgi:hypothetical protein
LKKDLQEVKVLFRDIRRLKIMVFGCVPRHMRLNNAVMTGVLIMRLFLSLWNISKTKTFLASSKLQISKEALLVMQ